MKQFFLILITGFFYSCDFSTHEYYSYEFEKNTDEAIYLGWSADSTCYVTVVDTSIHFDNINIVLPSDSASFSSISESYYDYEYSSGENRVLLDSTLRWQYHFNFPEDDARVLTNDSLFIYINLGDKCIRQETLYREKRTSRFIDRIPLPRTC